MYPCKIHIALFLLEVVTNSFLLYPNTFSFHQLMLQHGITSPIHAPLLLSFPISIFLWLLPFCFTSKHLLSWTEISCLGFSRFLTLKWSYIWPWSSSANTFFQQGFCCGHVLIQCHLAGTDLFATKMPLPNKGDSNILITPPLPFRLLSLKIFLSSFFFPLSIGLQQLWWITSFVTFMQLL